MMTPEMRTPIVSAIERQVEFPHVCYRGPGSVVGAATKECAICAYVRKRRAVLLAEKYQARVQEREARR